jgi:hypothetical protein
MADSRRAGRTLSVSSARSRLEAVEEKPLADPVEIARAKRELAAIVRAEEKVRGGSHQRAR